MKKRKPSWAIGGDIKWYTHYGKQYGAASKYQKHNEVLLQQKANQWAVFLKTFREYILYIFFKYSMWARV